MKLIHMVQTEGVLPSQFEALRDDPDVTLLHLAFRDPVPGAIYLPNSTWTQGRNKLLQRALTLPEPDYYVFSDDDVEFRQGSFQTFKAQLEEHRPAVGIPRYDFAVNQHDDLRVHTVYAFDAIMNAFHRDIVRDNIILPYYDGYDELSWWCSQLFVIHLCSMFYPDHVLRLADTVISNGQHRQYPRITAMEGWQDPVEFVQREIFSDEAFLRERFRQHYHKAQEVPRPPSLPLTSYRLRPSDLSKLNCNGAFFRRQRR